MHTCNTIDNSNLSVHNMCACKTGDYILYLAPIIWAPVTAGKLVFFN